MNFGNFWEQPLQILPAHIVSRTISHIKIKRTLSPKSMFVELNTSSSLFISVGAFNNNVVNFNSSVAAPVVHAYNFLGFNLMPTFVTKNSTADRINKILSISLSVPPNMIASDSKRSANHCKMCATILKFPILPYDEQSGAMEKLFG